MKLGGDIGLPIPSYRYVGMGANRFYDFLLIHKYLGLTSMVSLEHDPEMLKRAEFNVPYDFIDVRGESVAAFLGHDQYVPPTVTWLDYDGGIGPHIIRDIANLGTKLKVGDFFFATVYGGPPKALHDLSDVARLAWFQDALGAVSRQVVLEDVETSSFHDAVQKVLRSAIQNAFSARRDGVFQILLQVEYSDSTPMVTVGGAFLADGQAIGLKNRMRDALPFLDVDGAAMYQIRSLHLTERERGLFDRAVTKPRTVSSESNMLKAMGFRDADLKAYKDLIRFLPRYVETMV